MSQSFKQIVSEAEAKLSEIDGMPIRLEVSYKMTMSIGELKRLFSVHFGMPWDLISGNRKFQAYHRPRVVFAYITRRYFGLGLKDIGTLLNRGHPDVVKMCKLAENALHIYEQPYVKNIEEIKEKLIEYERGKS